MQRNIPLGGCGSGAGGREVANGSECSATGTPTCHRKIRRKRKELDALVQKDKLRRKNSQNSRHDLLRNSDSDDTEYDRNKENQVGFCLTRGCILWTCTVIMLLVTSVVLAAALKLLMSTRKDLDDVYLRLQTVEASSLELPAKFHESHVLLQNLEKEQNYMKVFMTNMTEKYKEVSIKVEELEKNMKVLQDQLTGSPELSSLPKNVASIQRSVATLGSSLQDVSSAMKSFKEDISDVKEKVDRDARHIISLDKSVHEIRNETTLSSSAVDGGRSSPEAINFVVTSLRNETTLLKSAFTNLNALLSQDSRNISKLVQILGEEYENATKNLTIRLSNLESYYSNFSVNISKKVANISNEISETKLSLSNCTSEIYSLNKSVDAVKGVERKLEGSQVQLASGVSELKTQLSKLENKVNSLKTNTDNSSLDRVVRAIQNRKQSGNSKSYGFAQVN